MLLPAMVYTGTVELLLSFMAGVRRLVEVSRCRRGRKVFGAEAAGRAEAGESGPAATWTVRSLRQVLSTRVVAPAVSPASGVARQ